MDLSIQYLTTKGLWLLLDRAKVSTIPPLLVQTISLGDEVLPPPTIARHAGFQSSMIVLLCLVHFLCAGLAVWCNGAMCVIM